MNSNLFLYLFFVVEKYKKKKQRWDKQIYLPRNYVVEESVCHKAIPYIVSLFNPKGVILKQLLILTFCTHSTTKKTRRLIWLGVYVLASIRYVRNIHKYNQNKEWLWSTPRFICKLNSFMFCTYITYPWLGD